MTVQAPIPRPGPAGWSEIMRDTPALPMILVTVAGHMMLFGMLTPVMATYAQGFGVPGWQIGLMISLFAVGRLAADLPAGFLAGRTGLRLLLWGGPALCGIGGLIGGLATEYAQVLVGRTVQGVGSGIYMTAATIYVARLSSPANRGKLMAMFQGAMLVGASLGPVLGGWAAAVMGPGGPFLAGAAIGFATALAAAIMAREPEARPGRGQSHHLPMTLLLSLPFLSVLAVNLGVFLTRTVGQWQILPLLATERFAVGPAEIGMAISLSALGTFAVLPLSARLIERLPGMPIIAGSLLATILCLIAVVLAPSMTLLMVAMVAMGMATGVTGPAIAAYAVEISDPEHHGPAMGALRFAGDLGYLVGPISFGFVIDATGIGQSGGMLLNAALVGAMVVLLVIAHRRMPRNPPRNSQPPPPKRRRIMTERIWDQFLTDRDKEVFSASGFGAMADWGKRPALLIIDVNYAFCDEESMPILESIKKWRTSCGEDAWEAMPVLQRLIETCRGKGIPVIYTTGIRRPDNWDSGSWTWKNRRRQEERKPILTSDGRDGNEIVDAIAPGPRDIVVHKQKPSGFAGTPLQSYLQLLGCDSVIVTGTTTSGCVRATVLDAFSLNFRVTVVEDGCFDRAQASHAINLCDMHAKYANVMHSDEVIDHLNTLSQGMFDLPSGAGMTATAAE